MNRGGEPSGHRRNAGLELAPEVHGAALSGPWPDNFFEFGRNAELEADAWPEIRGVCDSGTS